MGNWLVFVCDVKAKSLIGALSSRGVLSDVSLNSSRYLESRGSPVSEDISFLEVAHDDGNNDKDGEKESLDNTLAQPQALSTESQPGTRLGTCAIKRINNRMCLLL